MHTKRSPWHILFTFLLVINAIFWGLFPHSYHCSLLKNIGIIPCPSHIIHVIMGIASFIGAVFIEQGNFFNKANWD